MTTILKATPFDEDLLPLFENFNCAEADSPKFWEEEINEWIREDPATEDGALYWLGQGKGTQVWVYSNGEDEVIGYGSLCPSRWPDPEVVEKVKKIKKIPISLVPAVGLDRRFQNGPPGAEKKDRYSSKIMRHLIREARKHPDRQPFLGLYVHPENEKAIKFYRREQFIEFSQKFTHPVAHVDYPSFILKLLEYPPTPEE